MFCDATVEVTPMELAAGVEVVPAVIENAVLADASARSGAGGRMVTLAPNSPLTGGCSESVATMVKAVVPALVGLPVIWLFDSVSPGGSEPFTVNV